MTWNWNMLLVAGGLLTALPAAAQITQERATVSAGGGTLISSQYTLTGTIGQASPVGVLSNATLTIQAGFWHGQSFFLTIVIQGDGSGSVKDCLTDDNCPGTHINCGTVCAAPYAEGASVLLRAFPAPDSLFDGWQVNGQPPESPSLKIFHPVTVTASFRKRLTFTRMIPFYAGFNADTGVSVCLPTLLALPTQPMSATTQIALPPDGIGEFGAAVAFHLEYKPVGAQIMLVPAPALLLVLLKNRPYASVGDQDVAGLTTWTTGQPVTSGDTVIFRTAAGRYFKAGGWQVDPTAWTLTVTTEELAPPPLP